MDDTEDESPHRLGLLGVSPPIEAIRTTIARIANGNATVFIRGENGTGKEVVAEAIHAQSPHRDGPLVKVHAPALPDQLFESELFGHERGAFTGAVTRKLGRVELAEKGTLFLDEIAELSPAMQAKLLRLLQSRQFERVGGTSTLRADVRFIAATHRDLEHMIEEGTFRADLFFRLKVITIWLPPLRARREDVPLIVECYHRHFREICRRPSLELTPEAVRVLQAQRWPGNVRELINFVERLVVLTEGPRIDAADVQRELLEQKAFVTQSATADPAVAALRSRASASEPKAKFPSVVRPLREELRRAERHAIEKALRGANGNRARAARLLGISRRTLYTKLDEHGLGKARHPDVADET